MSKIPKNLTDNAMFTGYKEVQTFETMFYEDEPQPKPMPKKPAAPKESLAAGCISKELQEKIGKALLELKLELYKEGIVDYEIKVVKETGKIILVPQPRKKKQQ